MATQLPSAIPPAPAVMRVLGRFDRQALASFITVAIDLLDVVDGDTDAENATDLEDEGIQPHLRGDGPGCISSDQGEDEDEDCAGFEDEPLFDAAQCNRLSSVFGHGPGCPVSDPGGGNVTDEPHDQDDGF